MDCQPEVEVFRSMLVQYGVVAPDGSEPELCDYLCADAGAVAHFSLHYFSQPKTAEERALRSAYSTYERNLMLSKDLMVLSLFAQYFHSCMMAADSNGGEIRRVEFTVFYRMDYQKMRELISYARSKATDIFCDLRKESLDRKVPALLRKKCTQVH